MARLVISLCLKQGWPTMDITEPLVLLDYAAVSETFATDRSSYCVRESPEKANEKDLGVAAK